MAKKKTMKKTSNKVSVKKSSRKSAPKKKSMKRTVSVPRARPMKRSKAAPMAGTMETVAQPTVDVTPQVNESVVDMPPPMKTDLTPPSQPETEQKHEEFTQLLTQEPEKKRGFWARLFGRK